MSFTVTSLLHFFTNFARRLTPVWGVLAVSVSVASCANLGPSNESGISLFDGDEEPLPAAPFEVKQGQATYSMGATKHSVGWTVCNHAEPKGAVVIVQGEQPDFQGAKSCGDPLAQGFLNEKYSVLLAPRPGSAGTTGVNDLGGPLTLAATVTAIKAVSIQPQPVLKGKVAGIWGYGSGAGVAALAAKQVGGLSFLMLGGGFYDYEEVLLKTQYKALKDAVLVIKKETGDKGIEFRSVAYDISHLPKVAYIYHGAQDLVAPLAQARSFADSLRTSGDYQVTFKVLDNSAHWLKPLEHQHAIVGLLQSGKESSQGNAKP